jgi:hypothetical protein
VAEMTTKTMTTMTATTKQHICLLDKITFHMFQFQAWPNVSKKKETEMA